MTGKPSAMLVRQRNRGVPAKLDARVLAEARRELGFPLIIERHQCAVERSIPQCRQQKAVMHIEPLGVAFALRPGNDVRRAQQGRVRNSCQRAAPLPIVHQADAEYVLADPLHDQTFGLCGPRQARHATFEFQQGCIRKADR